MFDCTYEQREGQWICANCGDVRQVPLHRNCKAPKTPLPMPHGTKRQQDMVAELPEESRSLLIGDRLAQLFAAVGIPECPTCATRKEWLNAAHRWVQERFSRK